MNDTLSIPFLGLIVVFLLIIHKYFIYPLFISPLSKIPNAHPTSAISPAWILWTRYQARENRTVYAAHQRWGPVVRLGPNEISVNCVDGGVRTVYAGGFEKTDWYSIFANYGVPGSNMFSTLASRPHSARKRMLSNIYSKSYLSSSVHLGRLAHVILTERFLPLIVDEKVQDVHGLYFAVLMDLVTAYLFGVPSSSNLTDDVETRVWWMGVYLPRKKHTFWSQELPWLTAWLKRYLGVSLVPRWVDGANRQIEEWCLEMCDEAEARLRAASTPIPPGDDPLVYRQLLSAMAGASLLKPPSAAQQADRDQRLHIASEMLDHLAAGHETSAITLTYLTHELSQLPELQRRLRAEIRSLPTSKDYPLASLELAKQLDALPLLHAVLQETLRLHSAIPGAQPRVTPPSGCELGPYKDIPGGVRVQAYAYSLHRNEAVFPGAEEWRPERWLDSEGRVREGEEMGEMGRWFWAFGSGGRMCVGRWLAVRQMKLIIASIWGRYETRIIDDGGIVQEDAYTAGPKGGKLVVGFEEVEAVGA